MIAVATVFVLLLIELSVLSVDTQPQAPESGVVADPEPGSGAVGAYCPQFVTPVVVPVDVEGVDFDGPSPGEVNFEGKVGHKGSDIVAGSVSGPL